MKTIILFAMLFAVTQDDCKSTPIKKLDSLNEDVKVEVIAVIDGYRIYRFKDGDSDYKYFVAPITGHGEISTNWTQQIVKQTVMESITTVR